MKYIYIALGFISLGIGIIGILLPVMPTTPFLLVTAYCFGKGSKRFNRWFIATKLYKKYLENFIRTYAIPLKLKVLLLIYTTTLMTAAFFLVDSIYIRILITALVAAKYYIFIFKIKNTAAKKPLPACIVIP